MSLVKKVMNRLRGPQPALAEIVRPVTTSVRPTDNALHEQCDRDLTDGNGEGDGGAAGGE